MGTLYSILIDPFAQMWDNPEFLLEVVIGGLLSGVLYSLVALGYVLIYNPRLERVWLYERDEGAPISPER